jgi:hypothetical protein
MLVISEQACAVRTAEIASFACRSKRAIGQHCVSQMVHAAVDASALPSCTAFAIVDGVDTQQYTSQSCYFVLLYSSIRATASCMLVCSG